jgi:hypothetical protein
MVRASKYVSSFTPYFLMIRCLLSTVIRCSHPIQGSVLQRLQIIPPTLVLRAVLRSDLCMDSGGS